MAHEAEMDAYLLSITPPGWLEVMHAREEEGEVEWEDGDDCW